MWARKLFYSALVVGIWSIAVILLSLLLSVLFGGEVQDIMFWVGIVITTFGVMSSIHGNPTGNQVFSGNLNDQYKSFVNIEVLKLERDSSNYYKNFSKQNLFNLKPGNLTVILTNITILSLTYFMN